MEIFNEVTIYYIWVIEYNFCAYSIFRISKEARYYLFELPARFQNYRKTLKGQTLKASGSIGVAVELWYTASYRLLSGVGLRRFRPD
jgi:hypothetical protein